MSSYHPPPAYLSPVPAPASSATLHHINLSIIRLLGSAARAPSHAHRMGLMTHFVPFVREVNTKYSVWIQCCTPQLKMLFVVLSKTDTERNCQVLYILYCMPCGSFQGHRDRDTHLGTFHVTIFSGKSLFAETYIRPALNAITMYKVDIIHQNF